MYVCMYIIYIYIYTYVYALCMYVYSSVHIYIAYNAIHMAPSVISFV